jgi:hypothetical protein
METDVRLDAVEAPRLMAGPDEQMDVAALSQQTASDICADEARRSRDDGSFHPGMKSS